MTAQDFKEGVVYYSKTTQIFYRRAKGILYKLPTYANAVREWTPAAYRGTGTHFKEATEKQLKEIKDIKLRVKV